MADEASLGCPGDSGVGGILRDEHGNSLILFSNSTGNFDSNRAELLAVKEAVLIYASSRWCSSHPLLLECDNGNVVKWISNPQMVPWRLRKLVI